MIVAWSRQKVEQALGVPPDQHLLGLKLSLDGRFVEARIEDDFDTPRPSMHVAGGAQTTSAEPTKSTEIAWAV